jgi:hypothetical protein
MERAVYLDVDCRSRAGYEQPAAGYTSAAVQEVAKWLREEATQLRSAPKPPIVSPWKTEIFALAVEHHARGLESLADSLTEESR